MGKKEPPNTSDTEAKGNRRRFLRYSLRAFMGIGIPLAAVGTKIGMDRYRKNKTAASADTDVIYGRDFLELAGSAEGARVKTVHIYKDRYILDFGGIIGPKKIDRNNDANSNKGLHISGNTLYPTSYIPEKIIFHNRPSGNLNISLKEPGKGEIGIGLYADHAPNEYLRNLRQMQYVDKENKIILSFDDGTRFEKIKEYARANIAAFIKWEHEGSLPSLPIKKFWRVNTEFDKSSPVPVGIYSEGLGVILESGKEKLDLGEFCDKAYDEMRAKESGATSQEPDGRWRGREDKRPPTSHARETK